MFLIFVFGNGVSDVSVFLDFRFFIFKRKRIEFNGYIFFSIGG